MFRNPYCFSILVILTFFTSCVFESDDEFYKELTGPDPAAIRASLNTLDLANYNPGDTLDLYGTTAFKFSLKGNSGKIESAKVYLSGAGDSWKLISNSETNSFTIDLRDLSNGTFVLKLDLITRTGTGSLADAIHAEKYILTMKWVVRVDLSPPPKPAPTLDIVDGFLTLQWQAYTRPSFRSYVVKRELSNGVSQSFEIKDNQALLWKDQQYVGGYVSPIKYSVSIVSETGTATSVPISRIDPMDIKFSFNTLDSTFTFKWRATKFYGAFKSYKISGGDSQGIVELTALSDSIFTDKLSSIRFGGDSKVGLAIQSNSESLPTSWNLRVCKLGTPLTFTPADQIMFNPFLNSFIAVDEDKRLLELNENLEPVREVATLKGINWKMPYAGNYVYAFSNSSADNNIYRLNLEDNSEVSYDYFYGGQRNSHTVASNGLICIDYDRPGVSSANIPPLYVTKVLDPVDGKEFYGERSNTIKLSAVVSDDGKFIWANGNRVLKITGGTSELIGVFTGVGSFIGFRRDNSEEMMFQDEDKVNIYNTNTLTLIRTITPPESYYWYGAYDAQTKNMLCKGSYQLYAVNIETGTVKIIRVSTKATFADFYMVNGLLIYNGSYIKVN